VATGSSLIRLAVAGAPVLLAASRGDADSLGTSASVRSSNSLIVDIQLTAGGSAAHAFVTYEAAGVDPLVSRLTPLSKTGPTTITIGRLRADKTYTYTVDAIDDHGSPAGTARGSFTTGSLPPPLSMSTYTLKGRTTVPLVIFPLIQTVGHCWRPAGPVTLCLSERNRHLDSLSGTDPTEYGSAPCRHLGGRQHHVQHPPRAQRPGDSSPGATAAVSPSYSTPASGRSARLGHHELRSGTRKPYDQVSHPFPLAELSPSSISNLPQGRSGCVENDGILRGIRAYPATLTARRERRVS
jgi:hypothetical protein